MPDLPLATAAAGPAIPPLFDARRQAAFCEALAQHGNVRLACNEAAISPQTAYRARRASADLAACWDAALVLARSHAEAELADRALNGVEEPVFYHGEQVATRRRYDNRLLLAHLARLDRLADRVDPRAATAFDAALDALGEGRAVTQAGGVLGPPAPQPEELPPVTRRLLAMEAARPADAPPMRSLGDLGKVEAAQLAAFEAGEPEWWLVAPGPRRDHAAKGAGQGTGQGTGQAAAPKPRHDAGHDPAPIAWPDPGPTTRAMAEAIARAAPFPGQEFSRQDRVPGVPGVPAVPAGPRIAAVAPDPLRRFRPPRPPR
ncbi:MAG: hypothetical protein H5U21_00355 [Porphyrobacter sp.]|nr:hypothetical protein [Porphyrobacter sp.]